MIMKTKRIKHILIACSLAATLALTTVFTAACSCTPEPAEPIDAPEFEIEKIVDFADGANTDVIFATDGYGNGSVFNVEWETNNVIYEDGVAKMRITEAENASYPYYGAELRTSKWYHYGFYSVSMKPSKDTGTASTFFTYTGPYGEYDEEGNLHPWDEIDIEFLGKDTTEVQFNYYVNGKGGHEYMYDLGFDASEEFHTYGFLWEEDAITWYVDGEPVYQVTEEDAKDGLPSTPGRIMMNHWCGSKDAEGWMGKYNGYETDVEYQWVGATSDPIDPITTPPGTENPDVPAGDITVTPGEDVALTFVNSDNVNNPYTITPDADGKTVNVTYSSVTDNTYTNLVAAITDQASAEDNAFGITVTNNGDKDVDIRIDVRDTTIKNDSSGGGYANGIPRHCCLNSNAVQDGETLSTTDHEWGGSKFTVAAGATSELVVVYDKDSFVCGNITKDGPFTVNDITIFVDSHGGTADVNSGDITFSHMNFGSAVIGEEGETEQPGVLEPIITEGKTYQVNPVSSEETVAIPFASASYTVTAAEDNKSMDVTYTDIGGQSYQVINSLVETAAGENVFAVKIKNNGTETVNVRINVLKDGKNINVGATQDGVGVRTDMEWGGSFFTVAAGSTIDAVVYFGDTATEIQFMVDSSLSSAEAHSGNITVSEYRIGEATPVEA